MTPRVLVAGFGRCGSTMMMTMLHAGGYPIAGYYDDRSYELRQGAPDGILEVIHDPATPGAVKALTLALYFPDQITVPTATIWMDRDPDHQAKSHRKFLHGMTGVLPSVRDTKDMRDHYHVDADAAVAAYATTGPVMRLGYRTVLEHPTQIAAALDGFIGTSLDLPGGTYGLDEAAAAAVVHHRTDRCAPDLTFELTGAAP